eukprot:gene13113-13241_t
MTLDDKEDGSHTSFKPASATPVNGTPCQRHGPLARLKAELAELAACGNVQLQSLQPRSDGASTADAAVQLQAQVLDNVDVLKQQMLLTYSEARATATARQPGAASSLNQSTVEAAHAGKDAAVTQLLQEEAPQLWRPLDMCQADDDSTSRLGSSHRTYHSRHGGGTAASSSTDALRAFLTELQTSQDVQAARTAAALQEMRAFAGQQELRMLQPSMEACYANKTVAARLSMLQLETQVLQYQRIYYEATLAKLKANPGFAVTDNQQQQSLDRQSLDGNQQQDVADHQASHGLQRLPPNHSFSGWAEAAAAAAAVTGKAEAGLEGSEASSEEDGPDWLNWQLDSSVQHQKLHRQDREATAALTAMLVGAAESVGSEGVPVKPGYIGVDQLNTSKMSISRCVSSSSNMLQLSHSGLQPQQLEKVAAAIAAAPWVKGLSLAGNMLTDAAVTALVKMLLTLRQAANVAHLDLAHNQLLTWRCCTPLGQLLQDSWQLDAEGHSSTAGSSSSTSAGGQGGATNASCLESARLGTAGPKGLSVPQPADGVQRIARLGNAASAVTAAAAGDASPGIQRAAQANQAERLPQLQVLCIVRLSLEGVALGDKGAKLLSASLLQNQQLQVLNVARCGLHDSGGAAILSALTNHPSIAEVHVGWNALGHGSAKAVEQMFRLVTHPLRCSVDLPS